MVCFKTLISVLLYISGDFVRIKMLSSDITVGFGYFKPTTFSLKRWGFVFTARLAIVAESE